jgi:hypothetical protein
MPQKSKSKKKKPEQLYDENGRWVQERNRVKGAIRRVFRLFPQMKEVLNNARVELPPALKKDGTPGKKPQVRYKCSNCGGLFSQKNVQVDHINPVVPLNKTESEMSYDDIVRGICCSSDNLQVLCSTPIRANEGRPSCHKIKTDEENFARDELKKIKNGESSVYKSLKDKTLEEQLSFLSQSYKKYLTLKEEERLAKEQRKNERELKRVAKEQRKNEKK